MKSGETRTRLSEETRQKLSAAQSARQEARRANGPTYTPHSVFKNLEMLRKLLSYPIEDLAIAAGCARESIRRSELGQNSPRFDTVVNWAEALGFELVLSPLPGNKKGKDFQKELEDMERGIQQKMSVEAERLRQIAAIQSIMKQPR